MRVGIAGAAGYTAGELIRILIGHPGAELRYIQNVAIMMFCEHPEKFFGYTYVQMTSFPKGSIKNPSISEDFPNITDGGVKDIQLPISGNRRGCCKCLLSQRLYVL